LSFSQEGIWLFEQLHPRTAVNNLTFFGAVEGELDVPALTATVQKVCQRHDILRTTFTADTSPRQVVHPDLMIEPQVVDLTGADEDSAIRQARDASREPFDLATGPLLRVTVYRLPETRSLLAVTAHHLIADGWSLGVFLAEVSAGYSTAYIGGVPWQYADFARQQRDEPVGTTYWRDRLRDQEPLRLPTDRPRPAKQEFRSAAVPVRVGPEVTTGIRALAAEAGATPYMVLLAAFQVLLGRLAGQTDVTVGSPAVMRQRASAPRVIGPLINMLALRTDLDGAQSFREVLDRVRQTCLAAYAHQDVPFETLVEELGTHRDLSRSPIFQAMLVHQEAPAMPCLGDLPMTPVLQEPSATQHDLELYVWSGDQAMTGFLGYDTDLFTADTAQHFADRLEILLSAVVAEPDQRLGDVTVTFPGEVELLTELAQGTETQIPDRLLHEWFEDQADRTPDTTAIRAVDGELTYRELDQRANQLAHNLRTGPEDLVGVCLPRTSNLIVALLAVLKTGAAYVPIDPAYPEDRIAYILNDARANTLITNTEHKGPWRTIQIDQERDNNSTTRPATTATNSNLAYVIYTSGSTGLPKGVMIEHRHTTAMITWATKTFTAELTNVLASTSVCFDLSIYEIFAPLAVGGSITLTENNALDLINTNPGDLTLINTVPSVAQELLTAEALPTSASTINLAGEPLSPALVRALHDQPHITTVNNLYGPSEDTTYSTQAVTRPADHRTPIGKPLHNTQAHVLDSALRPVPHGSIGELYLGGASITRGYHQRPALTAERYLPDPNNPGGRLYRTGDLVRWRPDGQLDYHGRSDHQIKHHGHRIEPAEIETTLQEHPHVTQAAVVKHHDTLAAYVVAPELDEDTTSLQNHLRATLPTHMIPTAWVFLDTLPLTPNRKIDRNALPAPTSTPTQDEPPRTNTERLIADVWQDILQTDKIGIHDNFFTLGGHSLLATRVTNKLQTHLHTTIAPHLLFQHPTIAELASALPETTETTEIPLLPRVEEGGRITLPSSFGQERLWFLAELDPQAHLAYNMTGGATLHGTLDTTALQHAITTTAQRHETLRTTLDQHHQVIHTDTEPTLTRVDLTGQPDHERQLHELLNQQAELPFDLAEGPLFRAVLVHLGHDHHALIVGMHHAISDGWSLNVLLREISAHYRAWQSTTEASLPPLKVNYADFAAWQRNRFSDGSLEPQLAFWQRQLAGATPLELPTDFPRPPRQTFNGATCPVHIGSDLAGRLDRIARAEGVTVFMVLLAAYQVLLAKMSNQDDIAVGSPVTGRQHPDVENLIGFFVNTLVLRTDLSGDPTFVEALHRVRQTCLAGYAHQDVPFEKVVEQLQPERDLSRSPLFQAMLVHQDSPLGTLDIEGLGSSPLWPDQHTSQFDLTLRLEPTTDGLSGNLVYNTDLFSAETAQRVADRYRTLLHALVTEPDQPIRELSVMPPVEVELLTELAQGTETQIPDRLLHEWFEEQADRTPDVTAIRAGDGELTYRELDQRANQLAHNLHTGPEDLVGVCLPRTLDLIITLLAVLKTGAAYVPIDPAYPEDRITYILNDARATTLITNTEHEGPWRTIQIDQKRDNNSTARLATTATNNNLAYVIYTSGSTGLPKGVMIEHRHTSAMVTWATETFAAELTNVLASTSVCFDLSVYEIFVPLAVGGSITLTENNALDLITTSPGDITLINTVPSVAQELLTSNALPAGAATINLAGEALSPALVRALYDQPHVNAVNNLYGPSEDTTYSTHAVTRSTDHRTPIGQPLHNTQAYVLDDNLQPVPVGSVGELYLGGASITRGYHQRPALTAERYLPDPNHPGKRLYRTGDLARWRPDGQLDYHGRTDHQIKHHGHRIEPAEIETRLQEHPDVSQAAVVKHHDILAAYVVAPELDEDPSSLRAHLGTTLPTHMIPTAWTFLDTLPLTPNRKIDRKALPAPTSVPTQYEPPRTDTERLIADVWQDVLEKDKIGVHDNFFTLGGHSLLATRITHKIQSQLHTTVPLHLLFQHPTISDLANELSTGSHKQVVSIPSLPRAEEGGRITLPSSFGQERLWFLAELDPQAHLAYNMTGGATLHGTLDTTALQHAITIVTERHETLRTTLHQHHQTIHIDPQPSFTQIDLTGEAQVAGLLHEQATTPFDLAEGPLFRAVLARMGDDRHALVIAMHHAVSDGWSLNVLLREITSAYTALVDGREPELAPLPAQYADFAAWQRKLLADGELEPSISYWRDQLAGVTPLELPTDFRRPPRMTFNGATHPVEVGADLGIALEQLAKAEGVTVFMLLLTAFHTLLSRITGQQDIAVGSPVAGRQHPDVQNLIGFFVNTLVLRADLSAAPSFREALDRVRSTCLDAYAHQDVPFEKLVEQLQPERDLSRSPLFQVMFVLDEAAQQESMPGIEIEQLRPEQQSSQFELTLRLVRTDTGLSGELIYNTDLFAAETAQRIAGRYVTLLSALVADPDQRIRELPVMPSAESDLLGELVRGEDTPISDRLLHEWFEDQVDRTPDATAIRAVDGELTYRELDQRANHLAHSLHTGPEDLVGVCLPRTLDLIIALLAVLKTGAAYVPIDPAYPEDRIAYILNDARANALIATSGEHEGPWRTIQIDQERDNNSTTRLATTATNSNLAYVIYTSGSTGLPKGVMIEHRHTAAMITWATKAVAGELTNVLASTSVCFDLSVYEIFVPLAVGGSITLAENNALDLMNADPGDLTLINTVPSVAQELLTAKALPTSALTINLAGEPLSPALVRALYDQPHVNAVNNLYGPSEDTTYSTHAVTRSTDHRTPIGKPLDNTQARLLDDNLRPVPVGSIGELYLGGASITRGYHQRPALTAERYLPDPHNPGKRLYRTGDLARWRPDGQLDYHGRTDHQIKHHGHRIEPAEIETTLLTHPAVTDAAIALKNDTLVAYVVAPELDEDPAPLQTHLRTTLPTHMVPTVWVFLGTLPLTPNRKIDRKALPEPTTAPTQYEEPRTDTERLIAGVWQDVLEKDEIGIRDNFFTLGGHSLLATRITNTLQTHLHTTIPLHLVFQHPTIAELAEALPDLSHSTTKAATIPRLRRSLRAEEPTRFDGDEQSKERN
jgi:amino acid adenylation domain-containing protein